jgi:hypothetical protein
MLINRWLAVCWMNDARLEYHDTRYAPTRTSSRHRMFCRVVRSFVIRSHLSTAQAGRLRTTVRIGGCSSCSRVNQHGAEGGRGGRGGGGLSLCWSINCYPINCYPGASHCQDCRKCCCWSHAFVQSRRRAAVPVSLTPASVWVATVHTHAAGTGIRGLPCKATSWAAPPPPPPPPLLLLLPSKQFKPFFNGD